MFPEYFNTSGLQSSFRKKVLYRITHWNSENCHSRYTHCSLW